MLSYTVLAFTSVLVALLLEWRVIRSGLLKTSSFYLAYLIVLGFQLLTNGYLTSNEIVQYNEETIIGLRLAFAPLEDLLFGFSLVMLTMAVWVRLGANDISKARKSGSVQ
jgi:lycopene cyclase domain-containing protein